MSRVRRIECCTGTNTAINTTANAGSWRSNTTTRTGPDPWNYNTDPEPGCPSRNTANESDRAAGNCCAPNFADTIARYAAGNCCAPNTFSDPVAG